MANKDDRIPENAEGMYYADGNCIDCGLCVETAKHNFIHDGESGFAFVSKQPENEYEEALCKEAMESCPASAIGNDGD